MPIDPAKPFDLEFMVMPACDRERLDLFVKAMVPSMSRTRIQRRIGEGRVEVNAVARPANWRVLAGDGVLLRCRIPAEGADAGRRIPLRVLYEDDDVVVVDKQPGLVVHPVGKHRHDTLLNALYWRYKDVLPGDAAVSLANRLDQYTSGVILATKNTAAKRIVQEDFERRIPEKTYLALCRGIVEGDAGEIDLPVGRADFGRDSRRMAVRHDGAGKDALTRYRVEERFAAGFTLVRLKPVTGRQHQLRVHMSAIGHPLAADLQYGGGRRLVLVRGDGAEALLDRYALHACRFAFRHPGTGARMEFSAPLAGDMEASIAALRQGAEERSSWDR